MIDYRGKQIQGYANNRGFRNIFDLVGNGAPTSGTSGTGAKIAGPGSSYFDYTNKIYYWNSGTLNSPTWSLDGLINVTGDITVNGSGVSSIGANKVLASMLATEVLVKATGSISAANITGTGAGQLGHANGVVLVAAAGAGKIINFKALLLEMDFLTAAYTGGGVTGVKLEAGGVAVSTTVAAATFIQAAADISVVLTPPPSLTVPAIYPLNKGLNLVSASAPTQPGTAAGIIQWTLFYQILTSLLD